MTRRTDAQHHRLTLPPGGVHLWYLDRPPSEAAQTARVYLSKVTHNERLCFADSPWIPGMMTSRMALGMSRLTLNESGLNEG